MGVAEPRVGDGAEHPGGRTGGGRLGGDRELRGEVDDIDRDPVSGHAGTVGHGQLEDLLTVVGRDVLRSRTGRVVQLHREAGDLLPGVGERAAGGDDVGAGGLRGRPARVTAGRRQAHPVRPGQVGGQSEVEVEPDRTGSRQPQLGAEVDRGAAVDAVLHAGDLRGDHLGQQVGQVGDARDAAAAAAAEGGQVLQP